MDSASLFLLTHAVVHRKLVRDKAIQECIDSIRDGSVGGPETTSIIQTADTHRIYPAGAYLSSDPVN